MLGGITARAMFGGWRLYCDGLVFAVVAGGALFLKADKETSPDFVARGLMPFEEEAEGIRHAARLSGIRPDQKQSAAGRCRMNLKFTVFLAAFYGSVF